MNSIKLTILCIGLLFLNSKGLYAQQGPVTTGGDLSGSGGTASYSIGQIDYITLDGPTHNCNLGIQQPREFFTTSTPEIIASSMNSFVFPNPSTGEVTLNVVNAETTTMNFVLFNKEGQLLQEGKLTGSLTRIDLSDFAAGAYFIKLNIDNKEIKLFKIIKQ